MNIVSTRIQPTRQLTQRIPSVNSEQNATAQPPADSSSIESSTFSQARDVAKEYALPVLGGAAMFAAGGAVVGSLFGAPGVGALKGLGMFGFMGVASTLMENRTVESKVFNWSKTMPGDDATPRDLPDSRKNDMLFKANLATNAAVLAGVGAGAGAILAGTPGAIVGGGLVLVGGAFAEVLI
jgi:hypothetical protein